MDDSGQTASRAEGEQDRGLDGFRANVAVFSGPLDLLLYLIKRNEVDVLEIPVSEITEQYLQVLRAMQMFDVNMAADFLVMAATLMDIKARMLLPRTLDEEGQEVDPRDDLIRQLLQYKQFRAAADKLASMAAARALRFSRLTPPPEEEPPPQDVGELLKDVTIWDLVSRYAEVVRQVEVHRPAHIVYDEVPLEAYMDEVMERLSGAPCGLRFLDLFVEDSSRPRIIGVFLALLELVRQRKVVLEQSEGDRSQILVAPALPDEARGTESPPAAPGASVQMEPPGTASSEE
jgi:segregation and condensation protein A